jgi:hypothetical protein
VKPSTRRTTSAASNVACWTISSGRRDAPEQQLHAPGNHRQEIVDVVGHAGGHLPDGAQRLALHDARLRRAQVLHGAPQAVRRQLRLL